MDAAFWHQRWLQNELGFQLDEPHPLLQQCLNLVASSHTGVFVPLSGKTIDMTFLAKYMPVIGCELSPIACRDFFAEQSMIHQQEHTGNFNCYKAGNIILWQGDIFALTPTHVQGCTLIYDRAALIALPDAMRVRYVNQLRALFPQGGQLLLISLEYPPEEKQGPPFSVDEKEINRLFAGATIKLIASQDLTGKGFARRRFTTSSLIEKAYLITMPAL